MKILKLNIVLLFLGISLFCYGQQQKYFSNYYYYNPYAVNSASSGLLKSPELFLASSIINMNIERQPSTFYVSGVWTFNEKNFALGLSYLNDKVGVFSDNLLKISYAYRLDFNRSLSYNNLYEHSLSFGVDAGLCFIYDNLLSLDMASDPLLSRNQSRTIPVFGASVMYNHPNFFVGLSADNLIDVTNKSGDINQTEIEQEKPLYLYGGYRFWIMQESLLLTPSILVRHNFETPMIIDYSLKFDYNNIFLASVGYRDSGAINFSFGVKLFEKKMDLLCTANLYTKSNFFGNLFGIMLKYNLKTMNSF